MANDINSIINPNIFYITQEYVENLKRNLEAPNYIQTHFQILLANILKYDKDIFPTTETYKKFLVTIKHRNLETCPNYTKMLKLFACNVGLPFDAYNDNDLTLVGKNNSQVKCSKELFKAYFPNVLNEEHLCPLLSLSNHSLFALKTYLHTCRFINLDPKVRSELFDYFGTLKDPTHQNRLSLATYHLFSTSSKDFDESMILDPKLFARFFIQKNFKKLTLSQNSEISLTLKEFISLWIDFPKQASFIAKQIDRVCIDLLTEEQGTPLQTDPYIKLITDLKKDARLEPFLSIILDTLAKTAR